MKTFSFVLCPQIIHALYPSATNALPCPLMNINTAHIKDTSSRGSTYKAKI